MATVPNRYYNSPWIEDVGRNLASALKPPDIDVLRKRERDAWEFEHEKTKAANEATDRENKTFASGKLGEVADLFAHPVLDANGKPDVDATRAAAAGLLKQVYERGGPEFVNEAEAAAGPLSAAFMAKQKLRADIEAGQYGRLGIRNEFTAGENDKDRAARLELQERDHAFRLDYLTKQGEQQLDEINARNSKEAGSGAITLTPAIGKAIMSGIYQRIRSTGMKMDDAAIYKMFDEVADDTSRRTKNYATSLSRIWDARFPGGVYRRKRGFLDFGSGDDEYLSPDFSTPIAEFGATPAAGAPDQTAAPAEEPRNLRDPFTRNREEVGMENSSRAAAAAETAGMPSAPASTPGKARSAAGKSKSSPIPVKTPQEAAKLPPGTWVITPQGRVSRTKGAAQ